MHFNYEKFMLLSFFSRFNSTYTINDSPIVSKTSHKDLGVVITSDLKWNAHLEFILSRCYTYYVEPLIQQIPSQQRNFYI